MEDHPELAGIIQAPKQLSACEYYPESQKEILATDSDACLFGDINVSCLCSVNLGKLKQLILIIFSQKMGKAFVF